MLSAMPAPIFAFSSPHRPSVPSPLQSSPLRPSQTSPPHRDTQSSPIRPPQSRPKYASRPAKPNPLRLSRDKAQESRRTLFLKNVSQRSEDKKWQRRGGDQEVLKLEWNALTKRWRREKDLDEDGFVLEDELEDIPEDLSEAQDEAEVDAIAAQEEAELNAMLSLLNTGSNPPAPGRPDTTPLSDDEDYDALFMDMLSRHDDGGKLTSAGQMDLS
ncbi:hypothetical protein F4861DRAFT_75282 [Xylaria intraflava]|nr:hypothetical protein F4861DRAFT_75282 [Xylaria intraflava]